jgi:pilus assembly protein Flp/PilA
MLSFIKSLARDESGATMIEYGLIAALVSICAIAALQIVGTQLSALFNRVATTLQSAGS